MKVVCFYWLGDRWEKDEWGAEYINRLFRGVSRNLRGPFDFICFTNERIKGLDIGIEIRPFNSPSKMGVLPRLSMFSRESGLFGDQVLALDLDLVIVGSLSDVAGYCGPFCSRSKFAPGKQHLLDGDIMSFQAGAENEKRFWTPFMEDPKKAEDITGGRERYWYRYVTGGACDRWEHVCPNQIISYKRHVKTNAGVVPRGARIVSCHGVPRPHDLLSRDWVKENWR